MASEPLIDLDAVDLTRVVAGRRELDVHLEQRNRFSMVDGVLHQDVDAGLVVGFKEIRSVDWWGPDHIPGRPMFPGVLQIEAAAQLCAYDYSAHRLDQEGTRGKFVGFGGVESARFRGLVTPDCRFLIVAALRKASSRMFRYSTQAFVERQLVFEADVIGVLV